jgi:hypothetical protein
MFEIDNRFPLFVSSDVVAVTRIDTIAFDRAIVATAFI